MYLNSFIIFSIFTLLFFLFKKLNLLVDKLDTSEHKKFATSSHNPLLIGGIFIFIIIFFYFPNEFYIFKILIFFMLVVGLLSDINRLNSPSKRILFQTIIVCFFVFIENLYIRSLSLDLFDELLKFKTLNFLLTVFCFLILINGSNFIDGLNSLVSGYFIIVIACIIILGKNNYINLLYEKETYYLLISLIIFSIFNLKSLSFLGDSGAYILSMLVGYILVINFNNNFFISPYYLGVLLWYPAFENLFSLSRRLLKRNKVSKADNKHLHQLIFSLFKKKFFKNSNLANSFTSVAILAYNILIFFFATKNFSSTNILTFIIILNIFIYCSLYYFLSKYFIQNK